MKTEQEIRKALDHLQNEQIVAFKADSPYHVAMLALNVAILQWTLDIPSEGADGFSNVLRDMDSSQGKAGE